MSWRWYAVLTTYLGMEIVLMPQEWKEHYGG